MRLEDVDLTNADNFVPGVPYEMFDLLRREAPVYWHTEPYGGRGILGRHPLRRRRRRSTATTPPFSSHRGAVFMWDLPRRGARAAAADDAEHGPAAAHPVPAARQQGLHAPHGPASSSDTLRERTTAIVDRVAERGECDFVVDVAAELPLQVIADLMGVPQEDRHKVFDWSNRMIGADDPEYGITEEDQPSASMELFAYAHELADDKRGRSRARTSSASSPRPRSTASSLSELELDLFFLLLTVAGNETTRNLIAHGHGGLARAPRPARARSATTASLLPTAVDEMLRWVSPVMHFRRTATADTEIGGQPIKEGDKVVIWYISANRDETRRSTTRSSFDVTRSPNEHVAFGGGGPHFCLGANLARLEINVMFDEVLDRLHDIELTGPVERLRSNFINGLKHMPGDLRPVRTRGNGVRRAANPAQEVPLCPRPSSSPPPAAPSAGPSRDRSPTLRPDDMAAQIVRAVLAQGARARP